MGVMPVRVMIDELLLVGFDRRDRYALAEAIERAIAADLDARAVRARAHGGAGIDRIVAPDAIAPSGTTAGEIGTRVGRAVASCMKGNAR